MADFVLSAKKQRAVQAVLTARTLAEAAAAAGVTARTLTRWLNDSAFCDALAEAQRAAIAATIRRLAGATGEAVTTLQAIMANKEAPDGARVRAADVVLSRLMTLTELHDLEARLADVERKLKDGE